MRCSRFVGFIICATITLLLTACDTANAPPSPTHEPRILSVRITQPICEICVGAIHAHVSLDQSYEWSGMRLTIRGATTGPDTLHLPTIVEKPAAHEDQPRSVFSMLNLRTFSDTVTAVLFTERNVVDSLRFPPRVGEWR